MQKTKKIIIYASVIVAVLFAAVIAAGASDSNGGENMIKNGNFEKGKNKNAADWATWNNGAKGDTETAYIDGKGRDGSNCVEIKSYAPIASNFNQYADMQAGKTYKISGWIKTEGISDEGQGAGFAYAGYISNDEWFCEAYTDGLHGDNDWTYVEKIFTIPNEVERTVVAARIWFSTGTARFDSVELIEFDLEAIAAKSGTRRFTLSDTANKFPINGFGCEWDPKLLFYPNTDRGVDRDDIALIKKRIGLLNIHRFRIMVLPDWFEPVNDNDDPFDTDMDNFLFDGKGNSDEMSSLWQYLDICEESGVKVTLTWWGARNDTWLSYSTDRLWLSAPNNLDEMAENISALLRYALNVKKYTCVDSLILQNEPDYSFVVADGSVGFDYYVQYYKTVYERLKADGLGDKIELIGSDDANNLGWYKKCVGALSGYVTKFNSHWYSWSADDFNVGKTIRDYTKQHTEISDKPFFLGEFGDGTTVGAYTTLSVDTYERGLFLAVSAVNTLKAGSTGSLYWPLHDVYYYAGDPNDGSNGGLMKMGLFAYKDDGNWRVRPTYHAWGLVCNYMLPGSLVYDVTGEDEVAEAVAAKTPDGKWTILAVNRSDAGQTIEIEAAATIGAELQFILYDKDSVTLSDTIIAPSGIVAPQGDVYTFKMPAKSFAVLTNATKRSKAAPEDFFNADNAVTSKGEKNSKTILGTAVALGLAAAFGVAAFMFFKNKKKK